MASQRQKLILIIIAAVFLLGGIVALVWYVNVPKQQPAEPVAVRAQYAKGNASFAYPVSWRQNDIPTSLGFISVQVYDASDGIVFVASSNGEESDPPVDGTVMHDTDIVVGGISGKERVWENEKTEAMVMRADHITFAGKAYRFEMFGHLSRKILMENNWKEIMSSIRFAESETEGIEAVPTTSTESEAEHR